MSPARRCLHRASTSDPLAELVKIEPRSIGVGQYQHDLKQTKLAKALDAGSRTA